MTENEMNQNEEEQTGNNAYGPHGLPSIGKMWDSQSERDKDNAEEKGKSSTGADACDRVLQEKLREGLENDSNDVVSGGMSSAHSVDGVDAAFDEDELDNWREEGHNMTCQLLVVVFGMVMHFADVGTDIKVAVDHFNAGDDFWGIMTVILVVVPCMVMQLVSLWWFKEDSYLNFKNGIFHLLGMGPAFRYFWTIRYILWLRSTPNPDVDDYKRLVSRKLDTAMLRLFQAFMEDAPQLVLQLYIKTNLRQYDIELTRVRDLWLVCSLFLSLISLSWALVSYYKTLRSSVRSNIQLSGLVSIFLWRCFSVSSRVITLALFASLYKMWLFVLFGAHFITMFLFLLWQKISFFPENMVKQVLMKGLFAYVLFFSYFAIEGERTRTWCILFHVINGMEIISLIVLWYFQQSHFSELFSMAVLIYVIAALFLSILFMSLFYACCHPSHKLIMQGCRFKFLSRTLSARRRRTKSSTCTEQNTVITDVARVVCLSVV